MIGKSSDVISTLIASFDRYIQKDWSNCLDRRQVWNQKRPPWFEALHHMVYPFLTPIANILISSMQTGATIYQVSSFISIICSKKTYQFEFVFHFVLLKLDDGACYIMFNRNA